MVVLRVLFFFLFLFTQSAWAQVSYPPPTIQYGAGTPDVCFATTISAPLTGSVSGGSCSLSIPDASTSQKGAASFSSSNFSASSGAISIKTDGVGSTELASTGVSAGFYNRPSLTVDVDGRVTEISPNDDDATDVYVSKNGHDSTTCGPVSNPCLTITGTDGAHAKIPDAGGSTCDANFEQGCMRCDTGATGSAFCGGMDDCTAGQPCSAYTCSGDSTRACGFKCATAITTSCVRDADCPIGDICNGTNNVSQGDCAGGQTCGDASVNSRCSSSGGSQQCTGQRHTYRVIIGQGLFFDCLTGTNKPKSKTIYRGAGRVSTLLYCLGNSSFDVTDTDHTTFSDLSLLTNGNAGAITSTGSTTGFTFEHGNTGTGITNSAAVSSLKFTGLGNTTNEFDDNWFTQGYSGLGPGCFSYELWPSAVCSNDATVLCTTVGTSPCTGGAGTCTDRTCYNRTTKLRSNACATSADCSGGAICIPMRRVYEGWVAAGTTAASTDLYVKDNLFQCSGMDNNTSIDLRGKAGGSSLNNRFFNNLMFNSEKTSSQKICQGGSNVGAACTVNGDCPSSTCATTSLGSTYDMRIRRIDGTGTNLKVALHGNTFVSDAASGLIPPTDTDLSVEANTTVYDQGGNSYDASRRSIAGTLTYADTTVAGGGSSWRGTLINDPTNPQNGECWTILSATDLLKCRFDGTTYSIPTLTRDETLTNKTLTSPMINTPTIPATEWSSAKHTHVSDATGGLLDATYFTWAGATGAKTAIISSNNVGTLQIGGNSSTQSIIGSATNGTTLKIEGTSGSNGQVQLGDSLFAVDEQNGRVYLGALNCTAPGNAAACVTGDLTVSAAGTAANSVVTRTATQTITNKSIDALQLTGTVANARLDSSAAAFLKDGGTSNLTCGSSNQGKTQVMDDGRRQYCDGASTSVLRWSPMVLFTQTADQAISNTTTETTIFGSGQGSLTIPSGLLNRVGATIRIRIAGVHQTKASSPGTLGVKVKLGSTVVLSRTGAGLTAGVPASSWFEIVATGTVRTTGASGTMQWYGSYRNDQGGFQVGPSEWALNGAAGATAQPVTVDVTGAPVLDTTLQFSTADTTNNNTSQVATVELLN